MAVAQPLAGAFTHRHARPGVVYPHLESLRSRWVKLEHETHDFVFSRTEADLLRVGSYTNFRGEEWSYPLWQQMLHQANHAAQHRSEAAVILSGWNSSPGSMDFLFFVDNVRSQNKPAESVVYEWFK